VVRLLTTNLQSAALTWNFGNEIFRLWIDHANMQFVTGCCSSDFVIFGPFCHLCQRQVKWLTWQPPKKLPRSATFLDFLPVKITAVIRSLSVSQFEKCLHPSFQFHFWPACCFPKGSRRLFQLGKKPFFASPHFISSAEYYFLPCCFLAPTIWSWPSALCLRSE
jgi:hypothetical protein